MSKSRFAPKGLLVIALALGASAAPAAPMSPFMPLAGTWSGGGTLSTSDGMQERLRRRASYAVAGTGSEVGRAGVILNEETHQKKIIFHPQMMPRIVIADPELTIGLPPAVTAASA